LEGTIYSAAEEVERLGGRALAVAVDVRDYAQIENAVKLGVEKFGGTHPPPPSAPPPPLSISTTSTTPTTSTSSTP